MRQCSCYQPISGHCNKLEIVGEKKKKKKSFTQTTLQFIVPTRQVNTFSFSFFGCLEFGTIESCRLQLFDLFFCYRWRCFDFFPFNARTLFSFDVPYHCWVLAQTWFNLERTSIYNRNFIALAWTLNTEFYLICAMDTAFTPSQHPMHISQAKRQDKIKMNLSKRNNDFLFVFFHFHFHFRFVENPFSSFDFEPTKYACVGSASFEYTRKSVDGMQSKLFVLFFFLCRWSCR